MSRAYLELSEGLPPGAVTANPAPPAGGRALKQWMDELPRHNIVRTGEFIRDAGFSAMSVPMSGADRFHQIETLRPVAIETILWLERQFLNSPLPLTDERLAAATLAQQLHMALADGYRMACAEICHPDGKIPLLRGGNVALAVGRGLWHYTQALQLTWKIYRDPPEGVWLGLHRLYRFAAESRLHQKQLDDPLVPGGYRPQLEYTQTALLALVNPLAFAPAEQDRIRQLVSECDGHCVIVGPSGSEHRAPLPQDETRPVALSEDVGYIDFARFYQTLSEAAADARDGVAVLTPPSGRVEAPVALLRRMLRALGQAAARGAPRLPGGFELETAVGLSAVHYFAAGRMDFDGYLQNLSRLGSQGIRPAAEWLQAGEHSVHRLLPAQVLDHGLGGYRLQWSAGQQPRARIGELVGLNGAAPGLEPDWMLGVIRWLRYGADGSLMAGVELLSRRCLAVAVRPGGDQRGQAMRALALQPLDAGLAPGYVLAGRLDAPKSGFDVRFGYEPYRLGPPSGVRTVKASVAHAALAMDYTLLTEES